MIQNQPNDIEPKILDKKVEKNSLPEKTIDERVEQGSTQEKKEGYSDQVLDEKLRQQLEKIDADDSLKTSTQSNAQDLKSLQDKEKIEKLLKIAKDKGVIFAISVAKKMNDPFVLDALHDLLVKEGLYKSFLK